MAKKTATDLLMREFTRGLGRMGGFRTWKSAEKVIANKIVDPNSKFRKAMNRFDITSTVKGSLKKAYSIIDLFIEEYTLDKKLIQKSIYISLDIKKIERKLQSIEKLIRNEDDEFELETCKAFWLEVKQEVVGNG